jgi:peptide/nickel transport system substrate-binding protein
MKNNWFFDPDYPVLGPWRTSEVVPGEKLVLERNPYYWKVDTAGNQLPYIDRVESRFVPDQQVRTLTALNGEVDITVRELDPRDRGLFLENAEKCDCRVLNWSTGAGSNPLMYINGNHVGDEQMAELLRNAEFKRGLSHAIDRARILNTVWNGLGELTASDTVFASLLFDIPNRDLALQTWKTWNDAYIDYNSELANSLLDEAGLDQRDADGYRTFPDGSPLELNLLVTDWEYEAINAAAAALIQENWDEVGLRTITTSATGDAYFNFAANAEWQFYLTQSGAFGEWLFPSHIFEPLDDTKCFPLVGQWWTSGGERGQPPEPGSPEDKLIQIYQRSLEEPDPLVRGQLLADAVQIHVDEGPFKLGLVANQPALVTASNRLHNVYDWGITAPWTPGAPGNVIPAQWFFR